MSQQVIFKNSFKSLELRFIITNSLLNLLYNIFYKLNNYHLEKIE